VSQVHGSRNNINQTRAIFNALQRMRSATDIANARGKRVLDMTPRSSIGQAGYRPD
jgi:ribosomal protein S5